MNHFHMPSQINFNKKRFVTPRNVANEAFNLGVNGVFVILQRALGGVTFIAKLAFKGIRFRMQSFVPYQKSNFGERFPAFVARISLPLTAVHQRQMSFSGGNPLLADWTLLPLRSVEQSFLVIPNVLFECSLIRDGLPAEMTRAGSRWRLGIQVAELVLRYVLLHDYFVAVLTRDQPRILIVHVVRLHMSFIGGFQRKGHPASRADSVE